MQNTTPMHYCKCPPLLVKSLISLFSRPCSLRQTLPPAGSSSESVSEDSLSATKRSTQPSGREEETLDGSTGTMRFERTVEKVSTRGVGPWLEEVLEAT
jgi:hypothetical protein